MVTPKGSMSTEGETCNICGRNLIIGSTSATSPRVDISSTCKVGQKLGMPLPLLTCSLSAWPSRLLYRRRRKSRRDLWITLYMLVYFVLQPTYRIDCTCYYISQCESIFSTYLYINLKLKSIKFTENRLSLENSVREKSFNFCFKYVLTWCTFSRLQQKLLVLKVRCFDVVHV